MVFLPYSHRAILHQRQEALVISHLREFLVAIHLVDRRITFFDGAAQEVQSAIKISVCRQIAAP